MAKERSWRYFVSTTRGISKVSSSTHLVELSLAKTRARMSLKWLFWSISARVCGGSPVTPVGERTGKQRRLSALRELDRLQEHFVGLLFTVQSRLGGVDNLLEVDVQRERAEPYVGGLADAEGDARYQLVLAVDDAGIEPAGGDVGDLERLLEIDGLAARAGGGKCQRQEDDRDQPSCPAPPGPKANLNRHAGIVDQNTRASTLTRWRISSRLVGSA